MDDQSHPPAPTPYLNQTHQYEQTNHKVTMQDQLHRELEAAKYLRAQHLARIDLVTHKIAKITNSYDSQAASSIRSQRRQELQTINNQIKRNNRDTLHIQTEIEQESNPYLEEQTMIQEKIETNISKQETLDIEITTLHEALDRQRRIRSNLERKTKDVLYLLQQSDQAYQHKQNNAIQKEEEKKRIQETLTEKRKDSDHYMKQTEEKSTASAVLRTRLKKIEKTSILNRNITQKHDTKEYKAIKLKERKILEMKKLIKKDEKEKQLLINNNNSLKEENHMMLLTAEEHERNNNEFSNRTIDLQQGILSLYQYTKSFYPKK
jgi:DNA repair exonuclease SbcCD ATPase subunit